MAGLHSAKYFDWLDSSDVHEALDRMWDLIDSGLQNSNSQESSGFIEKSDENTFEMVYNRVFANRPHSFYHNAAFLINELAGRIYGISVKAFMDKLAVGFDLSRRKVSAIMLYLRDSGIAGMHVGQSDDGFIERLLTPGEQSCHAIYNIEPSYAYFLQRLIDTDEVRQPGGLLDPLVSVNIDWTAIKSEIGDHFGKRSPPSTLSTELLLECLDTVREGIACRWEDGKSVYCAAPYPERRDLSTFFFAELIKKYGLQRI
jgi:hypothetical protein